MLASVIIQNTEIVIFFAFNSVFEISIVSGFFFSLNVFFIIFRNECAIIVATQGSTSPSCHELLIEELNYYKSKIDRYFNFLGLYFF